MPLQETTESRFGPSRSTVGPASRRPDEPGPTSTLAPLDLRRLSDVIRQHVIPELAKAERSPASDAFGQPEDRTTQRLSEAREPLREAVLAGDTEAGRRLLAELVALGVPRSRIHLELAMPVAREVGRLWDEDRLGFLETTIALATVQRVLGEIVAAAPPERVRFADRRTLAVARAPGDQHHLGAMMVRDIFHADGWRLVGGPDPEMGADLDETLAGTWLPLVCISLGSERCAAAATRAISRLRRCSLNDRLGVLVGGPAISSNPGLAEAIGADAQAEDAHGALAAAEALRAGTFQ